jgi:uncharacterized protein YdhG (YjbR/CyaY superfamily)
MTTPTLNPDASETTAGGFSAEERAAMKERAAEARAEAKLGKGAAKAEAELQDVLTKIAELPEPDRNLAERLHAVILAAAPHLAPKTWYGMPAYAKDGKIVCFIQPASKFKTRYSTLGFNDSAALDDGSMWPTAYGITSLTEADEAVITSLIARAAG